MGFPANLVTGEAVYIVSKEMEGGGSEVELFTDQDGRKYTRHQSGGLVPIVSPATEPDSFLNADEAEAEAFRLVAELTAEALEADLAARDPRAIAADEAKGSTEEPYPGGEKAAEGVSYAPPVEPEAVKDGSPGAETLPA